MPDYSSKAPGVYVEEVPSAVKPIAGVGTSMAGFIGVSAAITGEWNPSTKVGMPSKAAGGAYAQVGVNSPQPVNSWTEFTQKFGDIQTANQYLAHAAYGFFNNGGTQCWVSRVAAVGDVAAALAQFESIDEIAIVATPLPADTTLAVLSTIQSALVTHCQKMEDRVAILDGLSNVASADLADATYAKIGRPSANPKGYGAFYFPWIQVADPLQAAGGLITVPPSGHLAGIYSRSDAQRGVHKAPANEVIMGALGTQYPVSKIAQGPLNALGVNVIRNFNGTIKVYGARTLASDPQGDPEWKYINVRRLVNYLRESIDNGTQWVVFEPNSPELWSKIRRNVGAFLTNTWASGALFGTTPEQAFYVRSDETNNPAEVRNLGQVVTEIGVAIVKPAEYVVFRISQWAGAGQ